VYITYNVPDHLSCSAYTKNGDYMAAYMPSLTVDQNALKTLDTE